MTFPKLTLSNRFRGIFSRYLFAVSFRGVQTHTTFNLSKNRVLRCLGCLDDVPEANSVKSLSKYLFAVSFRGVQTHITFNLSKNRVLRCLRCMEDVSEANSVKSLS